MKAKELAQQIEFDFGDRVEYDNKKSGDVGMVTGISIRENGISYCVVWSDKEEHWHYAFELKRIGHGKA